MRFLLFLLVLLFSIPSYGKVTYMDGKPYIFDGDSISIKNERIRFQGIDCPEVKQLCKDSKGEFYKCGEASTKFLTDLIKDKEVSCKTESKDIYGRFLGTCYLDGVDISSEMIKYGHAIPYTLDYYKEELNYAKKNKLGVWSGDFIRPQRWRMKYDRPTTFKF